MKIECCFSKRFKHSLAAYHCDEEIELYLPLIAEFCETEAEIIQIIDEAITHELIFHHFTQNEVEEWLEKWWKGKWDWCWGEDNCGDEERGYDFTWEVEKLITEVQGRKMLRTKDEVLENVRESLKQN